MVKPRSKIKSVLFKLVVFSLTPLVLLLAAAEGVARLAGAGGDSLVTMPLPGEMAGIYRPDRHLFWSLGPDLDTEFLGVRITTNQLGLRSPQVGPKQPGEFRILSVGESTTFGAGVADDETYAAQLQQALQGEHPSRPFTVINGGVPAYSSFQGLQYIKQRGLQLEPDLVIFYHELNDYLPSSLRDSGQADIGVLMTDRELFESRLHHVHRTLTQVSVLYRWLGRRLAARRIRAFNQEDFDNPLTSIGLPDIALGPRLRVRDEDQLALPELNEKSLGRRVSDAERLKNLEELTELCREEQVALLIIHPAYQHSSWHQCALTRFCRDNDVPMFEAFDSLHQPGQASGSCYLDPWHPNPEGHRRLGTDLAAFISARFLD